MTHKKNVTGIVLSSMPIGEYDKRITILTSECGKISAFARGAQRMNSPFLAACSPFRFGEFELYEGRSSYSLSKVVIQNYFQELSDNLDTIYYGFYFLEFAQFFCQENNDEKEMLKLVYQSLRALEKPALDPVLTRSIFELKALSIGGQGPEVFSCIQCGKKEELTGFSVRRGGTVCADCTRQVERTSISDAARYTLQFIVATPVEKLYTFQVSKEVLDQLRLIMDLYMAQYVGHDFHSLQFVKLQGT